MLTWIFRGQPPGLGIIEPILRVILLQHRIIIVAGVVIEEVELAEAAVDGDGVVVGDRTPVVVVGAGRGRRRRCRQAAINGLVTGFIIVDSFGMVKLRHI